MLRISPSKPVAVFSAFGAAAIIALAWTAMGDAPVAFLIVFTLFGVAVAGLNLWAAFHSKGSIQNVQRDDSAPDT